MKTTIPVTITRHHKAFELSRYSIRFTLPNGAVCSDDYFSTITDAERRAAAYFRDHVQYVPEFNYSPGCFNA